MLPQWQQQAASLGISLSEAIQQSGLYEEIFNLNSLNFMVKYYIMVCCHTELKFENTLTQYTAVMKQLFLFYKPLGSVVKQLRPF